MLVTVAVSDQYAEKKSYKKIQISSQSATYTSLFLLNLIPD